jgi:antirestriction protein ArdC
VRPIAQGPRRLEASWLAVLKADKKAIFTAASKATEAAAFLTALQTLPTRNPGMR